MAHSRRKTPLCGVTTAESEKDDKRFYNRVLRRKNRQLLKTDASPERLKQVKEAMDARKMAKDGKISIDLTNFPWMMRK